MSQDIIHRSFGTHDGSFHSDEVTSCSLLLLYDRVDRDKIYRSRDRFILAKCEYVCDVGGIYDPVKKRFDHHQKDYMGNFSSAGMVLLYLKTSGFIDKSLYDYYYQFLIKGIDEDDTGRIKQDIAVCTFSQVIANFLPIEYDATFEEYNKAFQEVVDFVLGHLERMQKRYFYTLRCREKVKVLMEKKTKYFIFNESIPWLDSFFELGGQNHSAQFIIMPTGNHWKLRGIPPDAEHKMQVRLPLPLEWAGLHDEELQKVSQIPGAIFCHKGRFISIWKTKEDAIKALKYVFDKEGIKYDNNI